MKHIESVALLSAVIATGAGGAHKNLTRPERTFQAMGTTSASTGAATVKIQVSNDGRVLTAPSDTFWLDLATITLTLGTTRTSDGFANTGSWRFVRANLTALSGTDATVDVFMGA